MFVINAVGVLVIVAIVWWFWFPRRVDAVRADGGTIDVVVENGVYVPERIEAPAGQPLRLRFLRRDPTACAAQVVFGDLDVSADLPVNRQRVVVLPPLPAGEHPFTCQMGMYRGVIVAKP